MYFWSYILNLTFPWINTLDSFLFKASESKYILIHGLKPTDVSRCAVACKENLYAESLQTPKGHANQQVVWNYVCPRYFVEVARLLFPRLCVCLCWWETEQSVLFLWATEVERGEEDDKGVTESLGIKLFHWQSTAQAALVKVQCTGGREAEIDCCRNRKEETEEKMASKWKELKESFPTGGL